MASKEQEALKYYVQLIKLDFGDERTAYNESYEILKQAIDDLELYKKALLNSCIYTTELNSYAHRTYKVRVNRAKQYVKEYLDQARKELENADTTN